MSESNQMRLKLGRFFISAVDRLRSVLCLWMRTQAGRPMRPFSKRTSGDSNLADRYFIQTQDQCDATYSCSFVEYDGMGDYLMWDQHRDSWKKVQKFAREGRLLVVVYCHGWKNNSQSGDVLRFCSFLRQLAKSPAIQERGFRVHGVYLGWRGAAIKHSIRSKNLDHLDSVLENDFGESIVNRKWATWASPLSKLFEPFTYWGRKSAAENHVSGIPISRTIFSIANYLRKNRNHDHRCILMGHSMGALMMERSLIESSVGKLMGEWPWFSKKPLKQEDDPAELSVLPFDLILMLNSAAPSIYAKQFRDLLEADHGARDAGGLPRPDDPVIFSVTSEVDTATRIIHFMGNLFSPFSTKLYRSYKGLADGMDVFQGYFYRMTPGHNPFLINRWVIPSETCGAPEDAFEANLAATENELEFFSSPRDKFQTCWEISETPPKPPSYLGQEISNYGEKSTYWIIRVPRGVIQNHGDIWSQQSMEMMAALMRIQGAIDKTPTIAPNVPPNTN